MKRVLKKVLHACGYELSAVKYAREFLPSLHLAGLFRQAGIQSVLDVGANVGQFRDFLREVIGFEGWILSFEPVPHQVEALRRKAARDARWTIFDFALGAEEGTLEMNVMAGSELSSFLAPAETSPAMQIAGRARVHVKTLNDVLPTIADRCAPETTYLKIDTQGYDLNVLRGASAVLRRFPALQTELSVVPVYEGMPTFVEVYRYLKDADFDLTGVFPVSRDELMRVREFDGVFINTRLFRSKGGRR